MATDGRVTVSTTQPKDIDTEDLMVGGNEVQRQRVILVPSTLPRGCSVVHLVSAAGTNEAVIKNSPGNLYGWSVYKDASATYYPVFIKVHNLATMPTAGSTAVKQVITAQAGVLEEQFLDIGISYDTGIAITVVKGIADDDANGVLLNDVVVDLYVSP